MQNLFQLRLFESFKKCSGTEKLSEVVIIRTENGQAEKYSHRQIVEDFVVLQTQNNINFEDIILRTSVTTALPCKVALCACVCKNCAPSVFECVFLAAATVDFILFVHLSYLLW